MYGGRFMALEWYHLADERWGMAGNPRPLVPNAVGAIDGTDHTLHSNWLFAPAKTLH
jgi:hypothetical protein